MTVEINVRNVSKSFQQHQVLTNVDLTVEKGQTVGIVGANGSGKSVLFKVICGFIAPIKGKCLSAIRSWERTLIFQNESASLSTRLVLLICIRVYKICNF